MDSIESIDNCGTVDNKCLEDASINTFNKAEKISSCGANKNVNMIIFGTADISRKERWDPIVSSILMK
jgi:hypothetical protein